jgi:hypothetical protein
VKDDVRCEERGHVQVKGIAHPIATYAVIGPKQDPEQVSTAHLRPRARGRANVRRRAQGGR